MPKTKRPTTADTLHAFLSPLMESLSETQRALCDSQQAILRRMDDNGLHAKVPEELKAKPVLEPLAHKEVVQFDENDWAVIRRHHSATGLSVSIILCLIEGARQKLKTNLPAATAGQACDQASPMTATGLMGSIEEPRTFREDLERLVNAHNCESGSNTPDFILARLLVECLSIFDSAVRQREDWYSAKQNRFNRAAR